jgi:lipopolysaccharide cholinephosphotransferase
MQLTPEDLRKVQLLQLRILKEVHRICEKHQIKYFLSDGTLIGAVRHKGFIPWDDDLDIGMLREEYEKFCAVCKDELPEEYFLQTMETDPGYALPFAKVMLTNTTWIEENAKNADKHSGIYIDIFPYDAITKKRIKQILQFIMFDLVKRIINRRKKYFSTKKTWKTKCFDFFLLFLSAISDKRLKKMLYNIIIKYNCLNKKAGCIVTKFGGNYYKNQNQRTAFETLVLAQFEDSLFYIPTAYHSILTNLYGDYMTPPPVSKRETHNICYYKI